MPIYEYKCEKCGEIIEVNQSISAKPLKIHTQKQNCDGPLRKLFSPNAFHLKGGGWFKDGYSMPQPSKSNGSKSSGSENSRPSSSSTESKESGAVAKK
ncbi:MAG: FmdB family zinc ribbon protein [Nitrospinota bacterium]